MDSHDPYYGRVSAPRRGWGFFIVALVFIVFHLLVKGGALVSLRAAGASPGAMGEAFADLALPFVACAAVIGGCWLFGIPSRMPAYLTLFVAILALLFLRGGRPGSVRAETLQRMPGMAAFAQCQTEMFQDLQRQLMESRGCKPDEASIGRYARMARKAGLDDKEVVAVYRAVVVATNELGGQLAEDQKAADRVRDLCGEGSSRRLPTVTDLDQLTRVIEAAEKHQAVSREFLSHVDRLQDRLRQSLVEQGIEQTRATLLAGKVREKHFSSTILREAASLSCQKADLLVKHLTLLREHWGKWTIDSATGKVVAQDPQVQAQADAYARKLDDLDARFEEYARKAATSGLQGGGSPASQQRKGNGTNRRTD